MTQKLMSSEDIEECFRRWQQANPNPTTELDYQNAFGLLVAVILSAQSTDKAVNKVTPLLFAKAKTPKDLAELSIESIEACIKTLGLYRNKAKHLKEMAQQLCELHAGQVPCDRTALEKLSGVGRKTANVILNTAFEQPTMAVDTHIFRISNRIGLAIGKTVRIVEESLLRHIPKPYMMNAHHWLILHGRYVCVARKPRCAECLIEDICMKNSIA